MTDPPSVTDPTELSHFTPMFDNHTHLLPGTACYTAPNFQVGQDITFMLTYQVRGTAFGRTRSIS
jgi:hypothetical protein